jgi:hypothetical protein
MSARLVTAAELAEYLGVRRAGVSENAIRLGAKPLGNGPKPRLRFDIEEAKSVLSCFVGKDSEAPTSAPVRASQTRRQRATGASVPLLPIRSQIRGDGRVESRTA